jgi:hypothetical protein
VDLDGGFEKDVDGLAGLLGSEDARPGGEAPSLDELADPFEIPRRHPGRGISKNGWKQRFCLPALAITSGPLRS